MTARMHLDLHLDLASEPIAGLLAAAGGEPRAFTGYTGLINALEALREHERDDAPAHAAGGAPRAIAATSPRARPGS